ncbi:MAG TPA: flagellar hook-associated protein FlgK [Candidatus Deferrimicrobium sp.]|nr:flagellar hook-associated protein FlgK [Candidatus Deferrimicrobium sp.]
MPGLFQGLEVGKRALLTHQLYLQTIGHNIANVNTPGFSRQRVLITSTQPDQSAVGSVGTGVTVSDIRHIRDLFLGEQYRKENKSLGQWSYKEKVMTQLENLFNEPNDNTLSDLLNDFWDAWSDVSTNPSSISHRVTLLENANLLTNRFHELAAQLNSLRDAADRDLVGMTDEVNRITAEVARLNQQIKTLELGGEHASDLRDVRDQLLDDLSQLIDVNTIEQDNGEALVFIGAMAIVDGPDSMKIATETYNDGGAVRHRIVWEKSSVAVRNGNGQIKGLFDTRDEVISQYLAELDRLARTLVESVNALHITGVGLSGSTGLKFFDTAIVDAAHIALNPELIRDPARIAASATGEEGDNTIALAIQNLRNTRIMENDTTTLNDYYNAVVGTLGVETRESRAFSENYALLVHQVHNARQSVQGVSLDEEMTNMVKFQHAYDAAARVITSMDQALDTVINGMGVVGR